MQVIRHLEDLPSQLKGGVVAIGNFDGVHLGHQYIINHMVSFARDEKKPAVVLTLEPHPRTFFAPEAPSFRLTPFRSKVHEIEKCGVDGLIALHFDAALAATSAEDFVATILMGHLKAHHIVTGADFCFGQKRQGTPEYLLRQAKQRGFGLTQLPKIGLQDGLMYSSSDARQHLREGRPHEAAKILGRFWPMEGRVGHGQKLGRTLGYPTANVITHDYLEPRHGVYAVTCQIEGHTQSFYGAANYGIRPTVDGKTPLLEVFIFDFNTDIYDRHMTVNFVRFLRPEAKFDDLEALKKQIEYDCQEAKTYLESVPLTI